MAEDFKGDLYYVDPHGNQWRISRRPAERHPEDKYWHGDLLNRSDNKAHRVSVSVQRLLSGIDATNWESSHDGGSQKDHTENGSAESSIQRSSCLHPNHPEACEYPAETRHFG